jgi:hypothetical protein
MKKNRLYDYYEICGTLKYLPYNVKIIESPLWFHKRNLMQTSTGYGINLKTSLKVFYNNRWYRVYCTTYSNCSSCYIITKTHGRIYLH